MCGITGIFHYGVGNSVQAETLRPMYEALTHRGPDETSNWVERNIGFGFKRLSIIDLANGHQPMESEDGRVKAICNGEIYNFQELRKHLKSRGHIFKTNCDVEVIVPLYLEYGPSFVKYLNGQFAIAISDTRHNSLLLARDHFGICPLFYAKTPQGVVFGSEIKAILEHPSQVREINLIGLDQTLAFPGIVSPVTMFKGVECLKPGHYLIVKDNVIEDVEFWDLDYPLDNFEYKTQPESYYIEQLESILLESVKYRLNADVPVGFYLSGGLDSSLIGAMMKAVSPGVSFESFSIGFPGREHHEIDERFYQNTVARYLGSQHNLIDFSWEDIGRRLQEAVYFSECPLKETYNTCSLALSASVRDRKVKVILSGEGADELFGGYVGYRFDVQRQDLTNGYSLEAIFEEEERTRLWGDKKFFYERNYHEFSETKRSLYSDQINEYYHEFNSYVHVPVNTTKLMGRHPFHQRSYVDLKLRLSDHLISDHCDRTCYAHSIEGRYPFLDIKLIEFIKTVPPDLKLKNLIEKYLLKKVGGNYLPKEIISRQKQGFVAPGSPYLLRNNIEWVNDMLSYDMINRQGYFNPDVIERLKTLYRQKDFRLNLPFDDDLLIIVLTFNILLDKFKVGGFSKELQQSDHA